MAMKMLKKSVDILAQDNHDLDTVETICQISHTVLQYLSKLQQLTTVDSLKVGKLIYCMSDKLLKKQFVNQSLVWIKLLHDKLTDKKMKKKDLDNDEHQKLLISGHQLLWSCAFRIEKWDIDQREAVVLKCRKLSLMLAIAANQQLDWIVDKMIRSCHSYLFKFDKKCCNHYQIIANFYGNFENWANQQLQQLMAWLTCDDQRQLVNLSSLLSFYSNYWCCHYLAGNSQAAINLIKQLNKLLLPKQNTNKSMIALIVAVTTLSRLSIEISQLPIETLSINNIYSKQKQIIQACQELTRCLKSFQLTQSLFILIELFEIVKLTANNIIHDYSSRCDHENDNKQLAFILDSYNRLLSLSIPLTTKWENDGIKTEKSSTDVNNKLLDRYLPLLACNYKILSLYIKFNQSILGIQEKITISDLADQFLVVANENLRVTQHMANLKKISWERRNLGGVAYSIGLFLFNKKYFDVAETVLRLTFTTLIQLRNNESDSQETDTNSMAILLKVTVLRIDCLNYYKNYDEAFKMLKDFISSLMTTSKPLPQHIMQKIADTWVKVKVNAIEELTDDHAIQLLRNRFLESDLENMNHDQCLSLLEEEFNSYKTNKSDTINEQIAIINELSKRYDSRNMLQHKCWILIELMQLNRLSQDMQRELPRDTCKEIINTLTLVEKDEINFPCAKDLLATAHLWLGICIMEELMSNQQDIRKDAELPLRNFILAMNIWSSITNDGKFDSKRIWRVDITCSNLGLLSDFFALHDESCYRIKALTLRLILGEAITEDSIGKKSYNVIKQQTVMKYCELCYILCQLKLVSYATALVNRGRQILNQLSKENPSQIDMIDVYLQVTTALVEVLKGNIKESMQNIGNILLTVHFTKTILSVKVKSYIHAVVSTICLVSGEDWSSYEHNLLVDAAMENLHLCRILLKNRFANITLPANDKNNGVIRTTPENSEWNILYYFLEALQQISEILSLHGTVSESKRYLMEGHHVANMLHLSKRIVYFNIRLSELELLRGKQDSSDDFMMQAGNAIKFEVEAVIDLCDDTRANSISHKICNVNQLFSSNSKNRNIALMSLSKYLHGCDKNSFPMHTIRDLHMILDVFYVKAKTYSTIGNNVECLNILDNMLRLFNAMEDGVVESMRQIQTDLNLVLRRNSGELSEHLDIDLLWDNRYLPIIELVNKVICLHSEVNMREGELNQANDVLQRIISPEKCSPSLQCWHLYVKALIKFNLSVIDGGSKVPVKLNDSWDLRQQIFTKTESGTTSGDSSSASHILRVSQSLNTKRGRKPKNRNGKLAVDDSETSKKRISKPRNGVASSAKAKTIITKNQQVQCFDKSWNTRDIELITSLNKALKLSFIANDSTALKRLCLMLTTIIGFHSTSMAAHFLHLSLSISLRYQALASLGKKIRNHCHESNAIASVLKSFRGDNKPMESLISQLSSLDLDLEPKGSEEESGLNSQNEQSEAATTRLQYFLEKRKLLSFKEQYLFGNDLEKNFQEHSVDTLPDGIVVCTLSLVSTSNYLLYDGMDMKSNNFNYLLISRLQNKTKPILYRIPLHIDDIGSIVSYLTILKDYDNILDENSASMKDCNKKSWWNKRYKLDEKMKKFAESIEKKLLGCLKGMVLGICKDATMQYRLQTLSDQVKSKVVTKLKRELDEGLLKVLLNSIEYLDDEELVEAISLVLGLSRDDDAIRTAVKEISAMANKIGFISPGSRTSERYPVILILDKHLQHLPWENISILRPHPVSRMPSLPFVLSHFSDLSRVDYRVNLKNTFYILNPRNDLPSTEKAFGPFFNSNKWKGIIARIPNEEEFGAALTDNDFFIYCGHGSGADYLKGDSIQKLNCKATTLLMGCSSGKLKVSGLLEANGMAMTYLLAGCPCIVANMWDVTDKDIDRFTMHLIQSWMNDSGNGSLLEHIHAARNVCKLKYLVGASPVVYGIPICHD
ncbi:Separin [Trichoplax sp. H2]|nr:Separin [Trichoplax sp. H2]|eukprot:RDD39508.1 Separin [Trichoplax sp. H2]